MNFKQAVLLALILGPWAGLMAADKWNVMLAELRDLSRKPDKNTGVVIAKSLVNQFQRQRGFTLVKASGTNLTVASFQEALNTGRRFKADIIVYGDYYIEGDDLVIVMDVYDLLENRLRMRKYYSGQVDLDIFDTIDSMAADMVRKVREALPELTEESETRIRQIRQNIYQTEKISIRRMFYTHIGFHSEVGPKYLFKMGYHDATTNTMEYPGGDWWPYSGFSIGASLRYWDLRFDISGAGLPGIPSFDWAHMTNNVESLPISYLRLHLSYYLPFWNGAFALGIGAYFADTFRNFNYKYDSDLVSYSGDGGSGMSLSFKIIWNPTRDLELSYAISPFLSYEDRYEDRDSSGVVKGTNHKHMQVFVPLMDLNLIYFFGNFGVEARASVMYYRYKQWFTDLTGEVNINMGGDYVIADSTYVGLYLGLVYRLDFLD